MEQKKPDRFKHDPMCVPKGCDGLKSGGMDCTASSLVRTNFPYFGYVESEEELRFRILPGLTAFDLQYTSKDKDASGAVNARSNVILKAKLQDAKLTSLQFKVLLWQGNFYQ